MIEEGNLWCHNFSLHGVGLEMYFCTHNLSFNKGLLNLLSSEKIKKKILKEMGIPDHLSCLLRNLYAGQEATVRTGHGTTD